MANLFAENVTCDEVLEVSAPNDAEACAYVFVRRPGTGRRKQKHPFASAVHSDLPSPLCLYLEAQKALKEPKVHEPAPKRKLPAKSAPVAKKAKPLGPKKAKTELVGPCVHCHVTHSPQWRRGPQGILCNACGIRLKRTGTFAKVNKVAKVAHERPVRADKTKKLVADKPKGKVNRTPPSRSPLPLTPTDSPTVDGPICFSGEPQVPAPAGEEPVLQWGCKRRRGSSEELQGEQGGTKRMRTADSDSSHHSTLVSVPLEVQGKSQGEGTPSPIPEQAQVVAKAPLIRISVPAHWGLKRQRQ